MAKTYAEIMADMKAYVVANQSKVTDLNEGSVAASILEAVAREIASEYIAIVANMDAYQKKIAFSQFDFVKKAGLAATGTVVFTRDVAYANNIDIPTGTEIATPEGLLFTTAENVLLEAGQSESPTVMVQCSTVGVIGNVAANSITVVNSTVPGLAAVTNPSALSNGVDIETDAEYESRFREFILGLGRSSVHGVRSAVLAINGIKSCSIVEHFPAVDGYNFTVYAENGTGALPPELLQKVSDVVIGGNTETGCRAAGVRAQILPPTLHKLTITVTASINWSIPRMYIEEELNAKIASYISGLGIGEAPVLRTLEDIAKGQYGILAVDSVSIGGLPDPFTESMIARLESVIAEFE